LSRAPRAGRGIPERGRGVHMRNGEGEREKRIGLLGNPNVGKSVLFHRLTGIRVIASNYPGTTVGYTSGNLTYPSAAGPSRPVVFEAGERIKVIDAPGTYTLEATSPAEEVAVEILRTADVVVNIVDATNMERNLQLTLQLLERGIPLVVVLNLWDETKHLGIEIDAARLEAELGVPVVPTVAVTGEGIRQLVERLQEARPGKLRIGSSEERWREVGRIVSACQVLHHHHHTFLQRLSDVSVQPLTGLPLAAAVIFASFKFIRFLGESLIGYVADPLFQRAYAPFIDRLSELLKPWPLLHDVVVGRVIDGRIDFVQSFGIFSTGLYVELAMVLPYVLSFYLVLSFLEDFGYLPRLAVLLDNLMHRLGLHGYAIIPNLLGLGCNVPAILATRVLESRRERFIAATLISIAVPCAALQAMIFGLVGQRGGRYVAMIYGTLLLAWLALGLILNRFAAGYSPELIIEIPHYRMPPLVGFLKKVGLRVWWFLREATPVIFIGVGLINLLYFFHVFDAVATLAAPLMTNMLDLPRESIVALLVGGQLAGLLGMLLSIPAASTLKSLGTLYVLPELQRLARGDDEPPAPAAPDATGDQP